MVFLGGLADSCETYNIKLITYVLISNANYVQQNTIGIPNEHAINFANHA